jgi:hypothetical protein
MYTLQVCFILILIKCYKEQHLILKGEKLWQKRSLHKGIQMKWWNNLS